MGKSRQCPYTRVGSESVTNTAKSQLASVKKSAENIAQKINHRPEQKDLVDQGILLDTKIAPAIQQQAHELTRARNADEVEKGLKQRSSREELVNQHILHGGFYMMLLWVRVARN